MAFINFKLNLLSKDFVNKLKFAGDVGAKVSKTFKGATDSVTKLSKSVSAIKFASVAMGATSIAQGFGMIGREISAVKNYVTGFAEAGDKIAKTSRLVGLSAHDYQAFRSEAQHAGMSIEEMDGALKRFSINVGKARAGDKTMLGKFDALLPKKITDYKSNTEIITALADSYSKLGSAEQKAFVSQELFGKSGLKMTELLAQGSESLGKKIGEYEAAFSDDGAKSAEEFQDSLQDLNESINVLKASVAQELFPTFIGMFKELRAFLKKEGPALREGISKVAGVLTGFLKDTLPGILKVGFKIFEFVVSLNPRITAIIGLTAAILPPILLIGSGIAAIVSIIGGPVLAGIGLVVAAVVSWGVAIKSIYDNWDMLKSFIIDDVWGGIKKMFSDMLDFVGEVMQGISDFIHNYFIDPIQSAIGWVKDSIKGVVNTLSNIPLIGKLFGGEKSTIEVVNSTAGGATPNNIGATVGNTTVTRTDRFAVDFQNMPRGVTVTPPASGNFDYSKGYSFAPGI